MREANRTAVVFLCQTSSRYDQHPVNLASEPLYHREDQVLVAGKIAKNQKCRRAIRISTRNLTITSSRKRNETFSITKGMKVLLSSVAYANAINRSRMLQTKVKTWKEISNMVEQCVVRCTYHHRNDCFWYPFYAARTNLAQLLCCRERGWIVQHHTNGWMVNVATHTHSTQLAHFPFDRPSSISRVEEHNSNRNGHRQ